MHVDKLSGEGQSDWAYHRSGGEHAMKHMGDAKFVEESRANRGLLPIENIKGEDVFGLMGKGGLVTVRQSHDGGYGGVLCYALASRVYRGLDPNKGELVKTSQPIVARRLTECIEILDFFVPPEVKENTGKKLASYAIGRLVDFNFTIVPSYGMVLFAPDELVIGKKQYPLSGNVHEISDPKNVPWFRDIIAGNKLSVTMQLPDGTTTVYKEGAVVLKGYRDPSIFSTVLAVANKLNPEGFTIDLPGV